MVEGAWRLGMWEHPRRQALARAIQDTAAAKAAGSPRFVKDP